MMVGLQGSGKTTTTAKLAKRLTEREKPQGADGLARHAPPGRAGAARRARPADRRRHAADRRRPDAGRRSRAARSKAGRLGGYDVVLLDTAGRTTLDEAMMAEAAEVKRAANPHEVLLVADALTGQDAVNLARSFNERVGLTGIVLTRVDGDGRGGAALSMRAVTGKPIKLIGTGEKHGRAGGFRSRRASPTASSAWATSSRWSRRRPRPSMPKRRSAPPSACARARSTWTTCASSSRRCSKMGGMSAA